MDPPDRPPPVVKFGRLLEVVIWDLAIAAGMRVAQPPQLVRWTRALAVRTGRPSTRRSRGPLEMRGVWGLLVRMPCLRRSLILDAMHWRRGLYSTVVIGVAKDGTQLHAHAWLELPGTPANSAIAAKFRPIAHL